MIHRTADNSGTDASGSARTIHLVGAACFAAILLGAGALGVVPTARAHGMDRERRAALAAVNSNLDAASTKTTTLKRQLEAVRDSVESREVDLTPLSEVNRLMTDLTGMVETSQLVLLNLQPGEAVPGGELPSVPVQLWVEGTLPRVLGLIELLETEHPDLHVYQLAIEMAGPETVRLRLVLRWLAEPIG